MRSEQLAGMAIGHAFCIVLITKELSQGIALPASIIPALSPLTQNGNTRFYWVGKKVRSRFSVKSYELFGQPDITSLHGFQVPPVFQGVLPVGSLLSLSYMIEYRLVRLYDNVSYLLVQKICLMNLSNHMVGLSSGQDTGLLRNNLEVFLQAFSTNFSSPTILLRGHKPQDLNMRSLVGMKSASSRTCLFVVLNRFSPPLLGITHPLNSSNDSCQGSPPHVLPLCLQTPSFLSKLIRFNPSLHSLLHPPSLIPWQEDRGDL